MTNADFNGANLIENGGSDIQALANTAGDVITVAAEDLSMTGSNLTFTAGSEFTTATEASNMIGTISTSLDNLNQALARMGTASKALEVSL